MLKSGENVPKVQTYMYSIEQLRRYCKPKALAIETKMII